MLSYLHCLALDLKILREVWIVWTVIYIAPTMTIADRICNRLTEEGYEFRRRPVSMGKTQQFEISVRNSELFEIQELLMQLLHEQ